MTAGILTTRQEARAASQGFISMAGSRINKSGYFRGLK